VGVGGVKEGWVVGGGGGVGLAGGGGVGGVGLLCGVVSWGCWCGGVVGWVCGERK